MMLSGLKIQTAAALIAAASTFLWGNADFWLYALIALTALDYLTEVAAAAIRRELSSQSGYRGIIKKMMFFAVVAVAQMADRAVGAGGVMRNLVIGFLLGNEGISILENCGRCGLPVPQALLQLLEQLKNK